MNCTCKSDIEAKLLDKFKAEVAAGSSHRVELNGYGIVLTDKGMELRPYTIAERSVVVPKRAGGETTKKSTVNMFFNFCPFCGAKVGAA